MIGINEIKVYCDVLANKDQTGADFTPDEFNSVTPEAVYEQIRMYFGISKSPQIPLAHEKNQEVKDYLAPLLTEVILPTANGIVQFPSDYLHLSALDYESFVPVENNDPCKNCGDCPCSCVKKPKGFKKGKNVPCETSGDGIKKRLVNVKVVDTSQWAELFKDEVCYPTLDFPFAKYVGDGRVEVAPQEITKVKLTYLKYPPKPFWNYTVNNGIETFNPIGSTDVLLPRILLDEIAQSILERMGMATREVYLQKTSQVKKIQGV